MSGCSASAEGTRRFAQRAINEGNPGRAYRALGRTALVTSSLGFGSYRIDAQTPQHAAALGKALLGGVNLIDTSTNYADGSSETCIGNVLARHRREELIVVSKVGYAQGQTLTMARAREQGGAAFPEMVKYTDECWHCKCGLSSCGYVLRRVRMAFRSTCSRKETAVLWPRASAAVKTSRGTGPSALGRSSVRRAF